MNTLDHIDPLWFDGEKEDQVICGFDESINLRSLDISPNSKKSDRFLPYRLIEDQQPPKEKGDSCLFLIKDEWIECEFLGNEWFNETKRLGNYHQARMGRSSAQRQDGYIGWRERQDGETITQFDKKRGDSIRKKVANGERWGCMKADHHERKNWCSAGGSANSSAQKRARKESGKRLCGDRWMCLETGMISNAGALSGYQKKSGIDTSNRVKLTPEEMAFIYAWDPQMF